MDDFVVKDAVTIDDGQWMICIGDGEFEHTARASTSHTVAERYASTYRYNQLRGEPTDFCCDSQWLIILFLVYSIANSRVVWSASWYHHECVVVR